MRLKSYRFPGAWLLIDTTSQKMVDGQSTHGAMRYMSQESWFRWACNDPHEIESWANLRLIQSRTLMDAGADLMQYAPWSIRFLSRWAPWLIRSKVDGYRLNRLIVDV